MTDTKPHPPPPPPPPAADTTTTTNSNNKRRQRKKRRWGDAPTKPTITTPTPPPPSTTTPTTTTPMDAARAKKAALTQSIAARLAAVKAAKQSQLLSRKSSTTSTTTTNPPPVAAAIMMGASGIAGSDPATSGTSLQPVTKRAKVYDLDMEMAKPTFSSKSMLGGVMRQKQKVKKKKKKNPYLNHLEADDDDDDDDDETKESGYPSTTTTTPKHTPPSSTTPKPSEEILLDNRLAGGTVTKPRRRHRPLTFVEPGTYITIAEKRRAKAEKLAASGFASGRKVGTFARSLGITGTAHVIPDEEGKEGKGDYYGGGGGGGGGDGLGGELAPRADALEEAADGGTAGSGGVVVIPLPLVMEWWDVELLPGKLRKEVVGREGKAVTAVAKRRLNMVGAAAANAANAASTGSSSGNATTTTTTTTTNNNDPDKPTPTELQISHQTARLIQRCFITASTTNSRTSTLIQHPPPILPPSALNPPPKPPPTLHLTKREMKRQRKLRRAARQEELQANQMAGLVPPPPPRLTIANYVRVLGSQAVLDPSQMEAKVMEQIKARKLKHERVNAERKLTREQLARKRERKREEDVSGGVEVALFVVKDMGHRYHRTKVDLNAQQWKITGGVLECEEMGLSLVICEGGPKAVKAYTRLMLVRMKWKGENFLDGEDSDNEVMEDATAAAAAAVAAAGKVDEEDENGEKSATQKFNPNNTCELVWTGMAPKRMFNSFAFQACATSAMARKVLEAKGVAHFWDQVLVHASGTGESFNFKLGDGS